MEAEGFSKHSPFLQTGEQFIRRQAQSFWGFGKRLSWVGVVLGFLVSAHADPLDTWTPRLTSTNYAQHWDVTFGEGLFVALGAVSPSQIRGIIRSPDGVTWTPCLAVPAGELRRVIYTNGLFIAVGWSYMLWTSTNGIDWVLGGPGVRGLTVGFQDICYGQGKFVAIAGGAGRNTNVWTSTSGQFWQPYQTSISPLSRDQLYRIACSDQVFVAFAEADPFRPNTTSYFVSSNGTDWTRREINSPVSIWGLTWAKGLFVAVGNHYSSSNSAIVATSPDGISWTLRNLGINNTLSEVKCLNGLFLATGNSVFLTSTNGIDWDIRPSTNTISRFAYGNGTLVGVSGGAGFGYWGSGLSQSEPLIRLGLKREVPAEILLTGITGQTYRVEYADDLRDSNDGWQTMFTVTLTDAPHIWRDDTSVIFPKRYYRAVWLSR